MEGSQLSRRLTKKEIFTVPNCITMFRIALLPFIVWMFATNRYRLAIALIVLSALSDIADGQIARRFGMITDLGKMLDPVADKLTQGIVLICLALFYYPQLWVLIGLFIVKEIIIVAAGWIVFRRRDVVPSAKWFGKLNSAVLFLSYAAIIVYLLVTGEPLPDMYVNPLIGICGASMTVTMFLYLLHLKQLMNKPKNSDAS